MQLQLMNNTNPIPTNQLIDMVANLPDDIYQQIQNKRMDDKLSKFQMEFMQFRDMTDQQISGLKDEVSIAKEQAEKANLKNTLRANINENSEYYTAESIGKKAFRGAPQSPQRICKLLRIIGWSAKDSNSQNPNMDIFRKGYCVDKSTDSGYVYYMWHFDKFMERLEKVLRELGKYQEFIGLETATQRQMQEFIDHLHYEVIGRN